MSDSLKDKFSAKAKELKGKEDADAQSTAVYQQTVAREFPRMFDELLAKVRTIIGGADGVKIIPSPKMIQLTQMSGTFSTDPRRQTAKEVPLANVQVAEFEIVFGTRHLAFTSGGMDWVGYHGKIDVKASSANNPFPDGLGMSTLANTPDQWVLVVVPPKNTTGRPPVERLTDELLEKSLEQYFLK